MRLSRHPAYVAPALVVVLMGLVSCSQLTISQPSTEEVEETRSLANGSRCGVERWGVKTGSDADAASVNLSPQDNSVAALGALPAPTAIPLNNRISPTETNVWKLTNVTLVELKGESDSDYHLVIKDGSSEMIAEIPAPSCVQTGSRLLTGIQQARAALDAKFTVTGSFQTVNTTVSLLGVGMFDFQHGQTGRAPNAVELHPVVGICFGTDCALGGNDGGSDFSVTLQPASLSVAPGSTVTSTISTAVVTGSAQSIALAVTGLPAGVTGSFSPSPLTSGQSSILMLSAAAGTAAGSSAFTVSAVGASTTNTVSGSLRVQGSTSAVLANGDFERGDLMGWTASGSAQVVSTGAHGGVHALQLGANTPTATSTLAQTVTLPSGSPRLGLWYKMTCPDTVKYDWATVQVFSSSGAVLATPLPKTCATSASWIQLSADLSAFAGQSVTLSLTNHDDNYAGDPTFTLFDDVTVSGGSSTDTTPPTVSLSAPAAGATLQGTVSLVSSASDNVGVARVDFLLDGAIVGSATAAPFSIPWNSGSVSNGSHRLSARASDAAGNVGVSSDVAVNVSNTSAHSLSTVFVIFMENHNWSSIKGSSSAPYLNNTLLPAGAHAENYVNVPGIHPSEPNYLWAEAGTNFGILNDNAPSSNHQSSTQHLVTLLQAAGISWKSYQEDISGTSCPLTASGLYAPKHNPMLYFDDVTNSNNPSSANCIAHVRPYTELASDLQTGAAPRYVFITPNLCNDMHNSSGCATSDAVKNGDTWLAQEVPKILASSAYLQGGALFITWDESEGGDFPIGMVVMSPVAKVGYSNAVAYNHSSLLRTLEEVFGVSPFLGAAASATDLSDLFSRFP